MKKFLGFTLMLFTAFLLVACGTNEYTVTFDSNGGSEVASVVVEEGSKVDEPSEPTRLGYDFIEWQLEGETFDFNTAITENITLIAAWKEIVEVTIDEVTVTFTVTLPEETPDGDIYIAGSLKHENTSDWTPDADSGKAIRDGLTATYTLVYDVDDLPLEIEYKWTRGSWDTVEKDANGEELDNRKVTITKDNETFTINDTVASWADDGDDTPDPVVEYTVTFDTDGGTEIAQVTVEEGSKVNEPTAPTKDGFTFVEWQLEGETFDFDTAITKDITLVSVWEEDKAPEPVVEHTVTFDTDGGSEISAAVVEEGETVTEPEAPTKEGHIFVEWQLDGEVFDFDTSITKDITLIAIWEEDETPEPSEEVTVTTVYDGKTRTMDGSANNASQIGLDPTLFEVLSTARQLPNSQHVGLNANGQIRLYGHANYVGKNTLSILIAEGYVITNVEINFLSGSNNPLSATLMLGDDEILLTAEDIVNATKTYENLSIDGFSIRNTQDGGSGNSQIYIESIVITYKEGTATSEFAPIPVLVVTFDLNYEDSFEITRSFELNDELTMPANPTRGGFKFAGWFTDLETTTPFVSEGVVVTEEFTLYAKWEALTDEDWVGIAKEDLDITPLIFTSNGTINLPLEGLNDVAITWTSSDDLLIDPETGVVTLPDVEGETIVTLTATLSLNAATDTKTFEITLVVIDSDKGEEIVLYETGFESSEEFASSTTYNNTELNIVGPEENKWGFYYGTPSTTSPINGNQSAQMRWYTSAVENLGYARTMFVAENITKVEFNAKNTNGLNVNVSYSINGTDWVGTELFELTSSPTDYTYILPTTYNGEGAYIKFEISLPASNPNGTSRLYIDDVKIYGFSDNELTDLEKLNLAGDSLFDEFNNQLYDMNTKANLPTEGLHGVTITWDYNPLDAVVDGNWKNVTEDTEVTLTATLTLGEETLDKVIEITILFVDPDASNPETLTIQLTESSIWDSKTNSYVDGNFTKDFSGLTISATDSGIYTGGNYGDNKIQVRKNYNWIHNTTIPEGYVIKSIKVKGINSSGTIDVSYSVSAVKPTTNTVTLTQEDSNFDTGDISSSDYKYFYIKGNNDLSGTITIDLIVIELIKKVDIPVEPDQNPIITLEPSLDGMVLHSVGDEFIIPTATAQDYLGSDITLDIETMHDYVDVDVPGIYNLYWSVTDSKGYTTSITISVHVIDTTSPGYSGDYYQNIDPNSNLRNQLYTLLNDYTHTSYDKAKEILEISDRDPNNPNNVLLVYNRASVKGPWTSGGTIWNREHIVPQSILGNAGYGTRSTDDPHNLKPANPSINSSRGNKKYAAGSGEFGSVTNGWYPGDDDRGDVARIVFFMITKYPNLTIQMIGNLATFLEWHLIDPVDDFEMNRNDVLHDYTDSRNPYIDNPEWVEIVFGNTTLSHEEATTLALILTYELNLNDLYINERYDRLIA